MARRNHGGPAILASGLVPKTCSPTLNEQRESRTWHCRVQGHHMHSVRGLSVPFQSFLNQQAESTQAVLLWSHTVWHCPQ